MGRERPDLAVGAVVLVGPDGGPAMAEQRQAVRVLLVSRRNPPNQGTWSFPGGRVERGERLVEAVRREVLEETGVAVNVGELVEVFEVVVPGDVEPSDAKWHYVILDYLAVPVTAGQAPVAGDDALDARYVALADLPGYALTEAALRIIAKAVDRLA